MFHCKSVISCTLNFQSQ